MKSQTLSVQTALRKMERRLSAARLSFGHGLPTAADEALFLVYETLGLPLEGWERFLSVPLTPEEGEAVDLSVEERIRTRKPAAYIARKMYLQGLPFYVDERVIVPRSFIAEILAGGLELGPQPRRILDLCSGSGCLAILAAALYPKASIDAVELSPGAAQVARRNIDDHRCEKRVTLFEGDLFKPVKGRIYDLIITNPPYVAPGPMRRLPREYRYEPAMALAGGGSDGMDIVRKILKSAARHLTPQGGLLCEVGAGRRALEKAFPKLPFLWLDTQNGAGEVFWLSRGDLKS